MAPPSDPIADLLRKAKTIAVVGLSTNPLRASHGLPPICKGTAIVLFP